MTIVFICQELGCGVTSFEANRHPESGKDLCILCNSANVFREDADYPVSLLDEVRIEDALMNGREDDDGPEFKPR